MKSSITRCSNSAVISAISNEPADPRHRFGVGLGGRTAAAVLDTRREVELASDPDHLVALLGEQDAATDESTSPDIATSTEPFDAMTTRLPSSRGQPTCTMAANTRSRARVDPGSW